VRLDTEYKRKRNVSFWSEAIESMHLRVILSPFDKLRVNSVEESLNTSLRGRSPWQSMEGVC